MAFTLREFQSRDYDNALRLWRSVEGIGLSDADSPRGIARFLKRNPGLCFVAEDGGELIGAVLCGDDGRRGYLHHLAVSAGRRREGIGRALVGRCMDALASRGIRKCHIFVIFGNAEGKRFWRSIGWTERDTLVVMSRDIAR